MILSTGAYNVLGADGTTLITENLPGVDYGCQYTISAINSVFPGFGAAFIAIAVFFFAFTTLLSFTLYNDTNTAFVLRNSSEKTRKTVTNVIRMIVTVIVFFGATRNLATAWDIADIGIGIMCWINFVALLVLSPKAIKILKDYERQKKLGIDPVFEPSDLGLDNAELWNEITAEKYSSQLETKHEAERGVIE